LSHKLDELTRRFPEPIAFEEADIEDVREREVDSREQAPYSSSLWLNNWNSNEEKQLKNVLSNSALSAFGKMTLDADDVFAESNLIAPALDFDRNLRPANLANLNQTGAGSKCWADAVRK
jgi:hypothetical protein